MTNCKDDKPEKQILKEYVYPGEGVRWVGLGEGCTTLFDDMDKYGPCGWVLYSSHFK